MVSNNNFRAMGDNFRGKVSGLDRPPCLKRAGSNQGGLVIQIDFPSSADYKYLDSEISDTLTIDRR